METTKRINKNHLFMQMAYLLSLRSRCRKLHVGAVIVSNKRVIASGCNGPIYQGDTEQCLCDDPLKCGSKDSHHAESNAIAFAAKEGISTEGATIYCTDSPCYPCAKLILQAGIKEVIYWRQYRDVEPITYLKNHVIKVSQYSGQLQEYSDKDL